MSNHLKAYAAPKSWHVRRKVNKWIMRPQAGKHPMKRAMPIGLLVRLLGLAKTAREAKQIVNAGHVFVDGKRASDVHTAVGFMDVVKVGSEALVRVLIDKKGRLVFLPAEKGEDLKKVCRVVRKQSIPGGKVQLTLSDGRNILKEKSEEAVGDSLVLELPSQKVLERIALEKGAVAMLMGGRHIGNVGTIERVDGNKITCKGENGSFETLRQFAFVVGKGKPAVKVQ